MTVIKHNRSKAKHHTQHESQQTEYWFPVVDMTNHGRTIVRAETQGSSERHGQTQQHEDYPAEAQGSSGKHDQTKCVGIKAEEQLIDTAERTEPSWLEDQTKCGGIKAAAQFDPLRSWGSDTPSARRYYPD